MRAKSSTKSRSYSCDCRTSIVFHFFFSDVDCFIIQSIARKNRKVSHRFAQEGVCELTFVQFPKKAFPVNAVECLLVVHNDEWDKSDRVVGSTIYILFDSASFA